MAELLVVGRRQSGSAQTGSVGDPASLLYKVQEEGGLKLLVRVDEGVPNLVASRHIDVVGRGIVFQLLKGGVTPGTENHLLVHKGIETVIPGLEG